MSERAQHEWHGVKGLVRLAKARLLGLPLWESAPPTTVDQRGGLAYVPGGAGVADQALIVAKNAADAYATTDLLTRGDASTNTATSVVGEVALFADTTGKKFKRATGSGIAKITSGVLGTATSGTDYCPATSGSAILKGNGAGGTTSAVSGTDYAPATSGSSILKGNGAGGFSSAVASTDYAPATSGSAILKGNGSGGFASAASGTDYAPATSGTAILKGNGSGGFSAATGGTDYANASHTHAASDVTSGTLATARLGSGSAGATNYLRGDQTWSAPTFTVRTNSASVAQSAVGTVTASCNAGEKVTGGGCDGTTGVANAWLQVSKANGTGTAATGWTCSLRNSGTSGAITLVAHVVCFSP